MNLHTANIKFLATNNDFVATEGGKRKQLLTDETITTVDDGTVAGATLSYALFIDADEIVVTFDGTEYTCQKINVEEGNAYGGIGANGPDFSVYPFAILSGEGNLIYTQNAGTYTVKIETMV